MSPKVAVVAASIAAFVVATVGTALAGAPLPAGYAVAVRQAIYPGVDYEQILNPAGPVLAHVAHIAPGAAVDVRVVDPHDKIPTGPADLEMTSSMCRRVECVVAVNGDFHVLSQPVGGVVTGGRMVRSPDPSRAQLWVDDRGHLGAGTFPWSAALRLSDGSQVPIGGLNISGGAGPVLYTSAWGASTPPSGGIELVLAPAAEGLGTLNRPVPVTLQGVRLSPGGIPAGGAVIAVPASAADQLNSVWARVQQGVVSPQADVVVETPANAVESIGTTPIVLHGGHPALPWPDDPNVIGAIQPRTLVGWNAAGDVYFVVVDGRQPSSAGLTMAQAADMLLGLGATEAANLDGGGGSTFVVGGTIWNQPNDDPTVDPALAERVAANALVVLPRPGGPPAPTLPPRPEAGRGSGSGDDPGATAAPAAGAEAGLRATTSSVQGGPGPVLSPAPPGTPMVGGSASGSAPGSQPGSNSGAAPVGSGRPGGAGAEHAGERPPESGSLPERPAEPGQDAATGAETPLRGSALGREAGPGEPAAAARAGMAADALLIEWAFFAGVWGWRRGRRARP